MVHVFYYKFIEIWRGTLHQPTPSPSAPPSFSRTQEIPLESQPLRKQEEDKRQPRTDFEDPPRERRQTVYKQVVIGGPAQGMSCSSHNLNYEMK